jgi:hypothetical protein
MAYVLDSKGPLVLPFTDGQEKTLRSRPDPFMIRASESEPAKRIDNRRSLKTPREVYRMLPAYIKKIIQNS